MLKLRHYFFVFLKLIFTIQVVLVYLNKEKVDSKLYILTEILFKLGLGIFIEVLMIKGDIVDISVEDKGLIVFGAGLLVFDAVTNDIPKLLNAFDIKIHLFDKQCINRLLKQWILL